MYLLECVWLSFHVHLGGGNPCRRLSLLGFAHPIEGLWLWHLFSKTCIRMLNFDICFD